VACASLEVKLRSYLIGKDGEDYGFDGITFVENPHDADVILILGSNAPKTSLEQYRERLSGLTLPAICCNPDKLMLTPQGLMPAPGAIAAIYEEMGGKVTWIGKPYPAIYRTLPNSSAIRSASSASATAPSMMWQAAATLVSRHFSS
jgi:ribonucleotide monophosphatase NagD (HAD superfamily)